MLYHLIGDYEPAHGFSGVQPTSFAMRWDRGICNGSNVSYSNHRNGMKWDEVGR